jgi:hypothetical protein
MSNGYGGQNGKRNVDDPRNYRVRLTRFGSAPLVGAYTPSSLAVYITATSSMQARTNAQGSYPGYTVTDVIEA